MNFLLLKIEKKTKKITSTTLYLIKGHPYQKYSAWLSLTLVPFLKNTSGRFFKTAKTLCRFQPDHFRYRETVLFLQYRKKHRENCANLFPILIHARRMNRVMLKMIGFSKTDEFSMKNSQFNQNFIYFHHLWSKNRKPNAVCRFSSF